MFKCFRTFQGFLSLATATAVGGYLIIWHRVHLAAFLPILVIAACPLMHLFMHGRHARRRGHPPAPTDQGSSLARSDGARD